MRQYELTLLNRQVLLEAYVSRRIGGVVIIFNLSFVVKVTGRDELSVSHIFQRDAPENAKPMAT
ncbi:hypothetical protein L198_06095 [Cryptococcus wingfieldii CBS 7118]|uniref:Uncharacterized protein n=1 Tax=Cryptococcus wingfieldii CBS 7118 TaxID=1295528 RepID=A0A1E3IQG7_9TREE|nr:hypothetical protein L198_06095 [Cryptococcus wingfieldii CBS 7118]ODN90778.1 hypothetical protein L198_06095 [Cryptococcus wingfieldii CBS 7118]